MQVFLWPLPVSSLCLFLAFLSSGLGQFLLFVSFWPLSISSFCSLSVSGLCSFLILIIFWSMSVSGLCQFPHGPCSQFPGLCKQLEKHVTYEPFPHPSIIFHRLYSRLACFKTLFSAVIFSPEMFPLIGQFLLGNISFSSLSSKYFLPPRGIILSHLPECSLTLP